MEIDDLSLMAIDATAHLTVSREVLTAIAWHARRGFSDQSTYRFVAAVVMTDNLGNPTAWPDIARKIQSLRIDADLAALEVDGRTEGVL